MSSAREGTGQQPEIEAAAADWLVRQDRGLTPREQDEFLQWLAANPAHRESFQRHRAMWSDFNALAQWRPEHSAEPNPDLLARPPRRKVLRWIAPTTVGLAAAIAMIAWWPSFERVPGKAFAFEAAGYRQETLPDGSIVDMNAGAHVVGQFSATERRVLLVQGEAQFTVEKNPKRPFVVRAGGVDVRAVGTAFNVKLAGAKVEVLVTEGVVHVVQQPAASAPGPTDTKPISQPVLAELSAGKRTEIAIAAVVAAPVVVQTSPVEIERRLEWKPRLLDFDSTPLEQVVEIFNRRNPTRLIIGDDELRALPIVASIRSDNVAGFVRVLEATMGVRAERKTDGEIVLRRAR